jgi:hypothetical protein
VFDRFFGKGKSRAAAQKAELRGDLAKAVELYVEADAKDDAARVMVLRGDSEPEPRQRLVYYTQACRMAPDGGESRLDARRKRALLAITLAGDAAISAVARRDTLDAAKELEELGEAARAAEAYRLAGDREGEARALAAAGEVDELEFLLSEEQHKDRLVRQKSDAQADVEILVTSGRRRDALEALETLLQKNQDDMRLRERAVSIRSRRVLGRVVRMALGGERVSFVLGPELTIGREGTVTVASSAISRHHLRVFRKDGAVHVQDLDSRNGTQLRGINVTGSLPMHEGVELKLGREVPLRVFPSTVFPGAVDVDIAGERYVAALGEGTLPIAGWSLKEAADHWVELVCAQDSPAYLQKIALVPRSTLLVGDAIGKNREDDPVLKILGA